MPLDRPTHSLVKKTVKAMKYHVGGNANSISVFQWEEAHEATTTTATSCNPFDLKASHFHAFVWGIFCFNYLLILIFPLWKQILFPKCFLQLKNQVLTRKNISVRKVFTRASTAHFEAEKIDSFSVIHSTSLFNYPSMKGGWSYLYVYFVLLGNMKTFLGLLIHFFLTSMSSCQQLLLQLGDLTLTGG